MVARRPLRPLRPLIIIPPMPGLALLIITAATLVVLVLTIIVVHDATHPVRRSGAYAAVRGLPFDPGDLGLKFESWTLDRPGRPASRPGARLPVWEVELDSHASATRLTAVFIHGWGESRIDVLRDIEFWRDAVDRAVLYDLRGHGESSPGPSRLGHREDEDLVALLEHLRSGDRLLLVGRDLGANIAATVAGKECAVRDQIAGVIAIAPYVDFHVKLRERLRARDYPVWPMTNLAMMWFALASRRPLVVNDDVAKRIRCPLLRMDDWDENAAIEFARGLR